MYVKQKIWLSRGLRLCTFKITKQFFLLNVKHNEKYRNLKTKIGQQN